MSKISGPFLMVNPDRCMGCHTCELACAAAHTPAGSLLGAVVNGEALFPRNRVVEVDEIRLPVQCRQCEDAPCVRVCPTGATFRTETYTAINANLCIACKLCVMVCPFGAVQTSTLQVGGRAKRTAVKCDLCVDRPGGPACVAACPTHAISLTQPAEVIEAAVQSSSQRYLAAVKAQSTLAQQP
ncbi:MAG: 4Fe-4S dicluster domain-containing protein [Chloroflexi bacterium]|jgi:carbon-monoxide dehydrogenase iron sulfur subunit|nr:4Fe-4S dicluster domain-containing protein [Anaerolineaceae bacterium]NMB90856.1 4Fe-4S dicluster domain-containing protein [Chloroflexota bacterium]